MYVKKFTLKLSAVALAFTALSLASSQAFAAEYWLKAMATTVSMPDPAGGLTPIQVPMWGYASCTTTTAAFDTCGAVSVPGPALTVPPGDTSLTVHLLNGLTVPTSLVINGLIKAPGSPMVPVWTDGTSGLRAGDPSKRVRSFDAEAVPNGTADYFWGSLANPIKPGTYLYQSGTQPQVQVQMGLYGAAIKNFVDAVAATALAVATPGQAYPGTGYAFDNEGTLLYSEIDPELHAAVASGSYGTTGPTSTINYKPKYFLINGAPYQFGASAIEPVGSPGTTLLRLLNAGLTTHVPMINGKHWDVIAEDGKPYPYRRTQYTAMLPAAKTVDVLFTPEIGAAYPILDRRLSLSNNGLLDGGMLAFLRFASLGSMGVGGGAGGNAAPVAVDDPYESVAGVTLNIAAPGVLSNDTDSDSPTIKALAASGATAGGGNYTLNANGSFTYAPLAGFAGATDSFAYMATDGKALSAPATVTITFTTPAAPSLGVALDSFETANADNLGANWSQQVANIGLSVPDVGISGGLAAANASTLGGLAIWNKEPFGAAQGAGFMSGGPATASAYLVLKATGGTALAPANYVRVGCEGGQFVVSTLMGGSNVSVYAKQGTFGACTGSGTLSAVVDAKGLVTVFQNSVFVGGVQLPDVAAWKGGGRIGMQLTTVGTTADEFSGATIP
jgi:FtsP/CotA-like multicopper oxidase with cupredoxin domain